VAHDGRSVYFCGPACRSAFEEDPARYAATFG
jgi:YHS domain-containing protein